MPYQDMMSMGIPSEEERMMLLAQQLRGSSAMGAQLSTSSLEPIRAQGQTMQKQAGSRAEKIGLQKYRKASLDQRERESQARLAMGKEAYGAGSTPRLGIVTQKTMEKFEEQAADIGNIDDLVSRFDPQYATSIPLGGRVENWVASNIGGSEDALAQASWWKDFDMYYTNIQRHKLFGSALTATEQTAWKAASVGPNMSGEEIAKNLETIRILGHKVSSYAANNALNRGFKPEHVYGVYQNILPEEAWSDLSGFNKRQKDLLSEKGYDRMSAESRRQASTGKRVSRLEDMTLEELMALKAAGGR